MEWEHTEEKDQKAIESLQEVLKMKHQKQDCVDNLTALQTEEYLKGVWEYCKTDDEKIKELKDIINNTINGFEYENIDRIVEEKKKEQENQEVKQESALETFKGLLASE